MTTKIESGSVLLDASEARFLAARLRRLFHHFGPKTPSWAEEDDARLIGIAGACIGMLLTDREMTGNKDLLPYVRPQECGASGAGHMDGPNGPKGEVQCAYCGQPPNAEAPYDLVTVRHRLKSGDYNGTDIMRAWLAIDELLAWEADHKGESKS